MPLLMIVVKPVVSPFEKEMKKISFFKPKVYIKYAKAMEVCQQVEISLKYIEECKLPRN